MPAIDAGIPGHAVTARRAVLPGQAGLATLPLGACGPLRAGLAIEAVLARCPVLAMKTGLAAFPLRSGRPMLANFAITARRTIVTVLPVEAVLAGRPVLAMETGLPAFTLRSGSTRLAILAITARRTIVTVLPVEAVLAMCPVLAVKAGLATLTLRASGPRLASRATRSSNTGLAADTLGASRSGESRRGHTGETSRRTVLLPEMEIVPAAVFDVPHPKMAGGGIVIGISGLGMAREAMNVINKTENTADGGETLNAH